MLFKSGAFDWILSLQIRASSKKNPKAQIWLLASAAVAGVTGYLTLFVVSRKLNPQEFAEFVSMWTLLNSLVLTIFSPIEFLAPRTYSSHGPEAADQKISKLSLTSAVYGTAILIPTLLLILQIKHTYVFALFLSVGTYAIWNSIKAKSLGQGKFFRLFLVTFTSSAFMAVLLGLLSWTNCRSSSAYLITLPIAWLLSSIAIPGKCKFASFQKVLNPFAEFRVKRILRMDKLYIFVFFNYAISIIPNSFGLLMAPQIVKVGESLVSYVGAVMLTRAGLLFVNTVTPIFSIKHSDNLEGSESSLRLMIFHAGILVGASLPALAIFAIFGDAIMRIFLGHPLSLSPTEVTLIVLGECLLAATAATRTALITFDERTGLLAPWVVASILGILVSYSVGGVTGLAIAAITSGGIVLIIQTLAVRKFLK